MAVAKRNALKKEVGVEYKVSAAFVGKDVLTVRNKEHVNITGKAKPIASKRVRKDGSKREYSYREGTEDDRQWFYENAILRDAVGNPIKDAEGEPISKQKAIIKVINGDARSNSSTE